MMETVEPQLAKFGFILRFQIISAPLHGTDLCGRNVVLCRVELHLQNATCLALD